MADREWGSLRPQRTHIPRPFLKWAGGKGQVFPSLRPFLPPLGAGQRYFEPFLGGGAVYFALGPESAVLSDLNTALVDAYRCVKSHLKDLVTSLKKLGEPTGDEQYYRTRKAFNRLLTKRGVLSLQERLVRASMFIWLNHTCYNGLYRVNQAGEFNVPFGFYERPFIFSEVELAEASHCLQGANSEILEGDYERILAQAVKDDLAYLDPPYEPVSDTARFTGYTPDGFDSSEQERLSRVVHELVEKGCRVVLSNSPSPRILDLYRGFRVARVLVPRAINSVGSRRTRVDELIVVA
jgi:DNA adenine methylase